MDAIDIILILLIIAAALFVVLYANKRVTTEEQRKMAEPKQLTDGLDDEFPIIEENPEKLPPKEAREWLDEFLVRHQKSQKES